MRREEDFGPEDLDVWDFGLEDVNALLDTLSLEIPDPPKDFGLKDIEFPTLSLEDYPFPKLEEFDLSSLLDCEKIDLGDFQPRYLPGSP